MSLSAASGGDPLRDRLAEALAPGYTVEGELGRGGMSVVYRAHDVRLRRDVAIKILPPELAFVANVRERFMREAQTAAQLAHQNIVPIYGVEERDRLVWIVMALIEGETLGDRLAREGRLSAPEAQRVLSSVADALAYAHAHGVVHRDVKPDNILLERDTMRVLVTDFGIARAAEGDGRLTLTGVAVGTPTYMSPEQAMGESEIDGRSDLYSLGAVGYQMLAGAPPFSANSAPALLLKQVSETLPSLAARAPSAPMPMVHAIERALAKKPGDRWASLHEFRDAMGGADASSRRKPIVSAPVIGVPAVTLPSAPSPSPERPHAQVAAPHPARAAQAPVAPPAWSIPMPPRPPVPLAGANAIPAWVYGHDGNGKSLTLQAARFRQRVMQTMTTLGFLGLINAVTSPHFAWVMFPAFGMLMQLTAHWRPLGDAGVSLMDVLRNRDAIRAAGVEGSVPATLFSNSLAGRARRFVRRMKTAAVAAGVAAVSMIVGINVSLDGLLVPPVFAGGVLALFSLMGAFRAYRPLGRLGFRMTEVFRGTWRDSDAARTPALAFRLREEEVSQLAPPDVVMSAFGERLRLAVDDRTAIRQQVQRLGGDEQALLPDVLPTVDALVGRVAELSGALHQLDRDMGMVSDGPLDARIAELRLQRVPDDDRTLSLLLRQRQSLSELEGRRSALRSQLESASITLQNLRLDVLRLGSLGLEAPAMRDGSRATEQARALSKDLAYLLEGAREADRL